MQSGSLYWLVAWGLQMRLAASTGLMCNFLPSSTSSLVAEEAASAFVVGLLVRLNLTRFGF